MKRKLLYRVLSVLMIAGLGLLLNVQFGMFTDYNYFTARRDIADGKIQVTDIGEMPLHFDQQQQLAMQYGFSFHLFGCNVSTAIINGTEYYNNVMIDHLEKQYGAGWWTKFQTQLDSIHHAAGLLEAEK